MLGSQHLVLTDYLQLVHNGEAAKVVVEIPHSLHLLLLVHLRIGHKRELKIPRRIYFVGDLRIFPMLEVVLSKRANLGHGCKSLSANTPCTRPTSRSCEPIRVHAVHLHRSCKLLSILLFRVYHPIDKRVHVGVLVSSDGDGLAVVVHLLFR